MSYFFFFFNDTATTEIYTLSLHDALPILLLTAMHVDHVGALQHGAKAAEVSAVRDGPDAARERERGHGLHAFPTHSVDDPCVRSGKAREGDRVAAALELSRHPGRPVGVGRPPAARHELEHPQRISP